MVDIGGKLPAKERVALAQAIVQFPDGLLAKIIADGNNKKGDIFAVKSQKGSGKKVAKLPSLPLAGFPCWWHFGGQKCSSIDSPLPQRATFLCSHPIPVGFGQ
jgi:hypothetical protein